MENRLKNIKVVFADVDNTLLYINMKNHEGKRVIGFSDYNDWLKYNICTNAYVECSAPTGMINLITALHNNGAKVYGLTECSNSFEYNSKYNRLKECYPGIFKHHGDLISIDSRHKKVLIMQMIAERDGYEPSEIMFIDDSYQEVMEAFDKGFFAMHTTEALERFASPIKFVPSVTAGTPNAKKVLHSGEKIPFEWYCPNCKETLCDDGTKDTDIHYCSNCGQGLDWDD